MPRFFFNKIDQFNSLGFAAAISVAADALHVYPLGPAVQSGVYLHSESERPSRFLR